MIYASDPVLTIVDFGPELKARNPLNLTDTIDNMNLPVNCVLAQTFVKEEKTVFDTDKFGILKKIIFRE